MATAGLEPLDLDFLHAHVFEGRWKRFDQPNYRNQIWTVQSYRGFYLMAALAVFVTFVGSRSWVIARYAVLQVVGTPMRLHDPRNPEPLLHLSQGYAVWSALPSAGTVIVQSWKNLCKRLGYQKANRNSGAPRNDPAQSPWFGVIALFNLTLFIAMGIAIPALLTDGVFSAPVVKSQKLESCVTSNRANGWLSYIIALPRTDAIFQECFDELSQACDSQYYFISPHVVKRRLDSCPFPGDVCQRGTEPFEISYMNFSAFDVGINSPSKMSLSHRLTCAPLNIDHFLLFPNFHPNYSWVSARTTLDQKTAWSNFSVRLSTVNGPNFLSNESSGRKMVFDNGPVDVTVLPQYVIPFSVERPEYQELIHEDLRRDDGQSFMIVNRAGRTLYSSEVNDPFFSAHNEYNLSEDSTYYLSDFEATALGCVEQYRFCIPTSSRSIHCSRWGFAMQAWEDIREFFAQNGIDPVQGYYAIAEKMAFFNELTEATAVYQYLSLRNKLHNLTPLLRDQTSFIRTFGSASEPWTLEVETWFMKAILNAIFRIRMGAKYQISNWGLYGFDPGVEKYLSREWATCGRVLFRDPDYINVNWIGFYSTVGALCLIVVVSYLIEQLHKYGQVVARAVVNPHDTVAKIHSFLRPLVSSLRRKTRSKMRITVVRIRDFWRWMRSTRNPFGGERVWYGIHRWNTPSRAGRFYRDMPQRPARSDSPSPRDCYLEDLPSTTQ